MLLNCLQYFVKSLFLETYHITGIMYNGPQRRTPEDLDYFIQLSECQSSSQYRLQQTLTEASGLKAVFTVGLSSANVDNSLYIAL